MTYTTKAGGQQSSSFLFPELSNRAKRSIDTTLSLLTDAPAAAATAGPIPLIAAVLATTKASPPPLAEAARESLESSFMAQRAQGAVFEKGVSIASTPDVALNSHQVLSDSLPRLTSAETAMAISSRGCGCRACSALEVTTGDGVQASAASAPLTLIGGTILDAGVDLSSVFQLHSNPTATKTIFLDFDGHTVNNTPWENGGNLSLRSFYSTFDSTALTEIQRIWQRVAEDFAPFNVNVTTQDPGSENLRKFGSGDDRWGIRVAFTSNINLLTGRAITNAGGGGTAYYNSFNWSTDDVALVFNRGEYTAAETASHEVGHALNLYHDGAGSTTYYAGHGDTGPTSWGTIMGASWLGPDENLTQWSKGEYAGANNTQDDLAVITTGNGFGYRDDDHGNTFATATALTGLTVSSFGIIERNTDIDMFRFDTGAGLVSFDIVNASRAYIGSPGNTITEYLTSRGPNLDIGATLYRADQSIVQTFNPADLTTASFSINLDAGTYYLGIEGVGAGNPFASTPTGYTDYGSLGQYMLSGTVQPTTSQPPTTTTVTPPPAALVGQPTGILSTSENGDTATFQLSLSRAPVQDVIVTLASTNTAEGVTLTSRLVFTAGNWSTPQTVTIQGVDDEVVDGTVNYWITLNTSSTDPDFDQLQTNPVAVQNLDNDVAASPTLFTASSGALRLAQAYITPPSVSGSLDDIHASDDQRMAITEGSIALKRGQVASDLNAYQWTFDDLINARSLVFEGSRTANTVNDNFSIQFSTNNGKRWTNAFTISNTTESRFSYAFTSPLNGTVLVRAIDTNTTSKAQFRNTLYVDQLVFSTTSSEAGSRGKALEVDSITGAGPALATTGDPSPTSWMEPHAGSEMDVLPTLETSPLAGGLLSLSETSSPLAPDPLAIWQPAPSTLV